MKIRRYSELVVLQTFQDRFDYLKLDGSVGATTFGFNRYINQGFYRSAEWKRARNRAISRDNGCDLGIPGHEIHVDLLVHHMNPMIPDDIINGEEWILNLDFLVTTSKLTHNAIHYGNPLPIPEVVAERHPGDTKLW